MDVICLIILALLIANVTAVNFISGNTTSKELPNGNFESNPIGMANRANLIPHAWAGLGTINIVSYSYLDMGNSNAKLNRPPGGGLYYLSMMSSKSTVTRLYQTLTDFSNNTRSISFTFYMRRKSPVELSCKSPSVSIVLNNSTVIFSVNISTSTWNQYTTSSYTLPRLPERLMMTFSVQLMQSRCPTEVHVDAISMTVRKFGASVNIPLSPTLWATSSPPSRYLHLL